MPDPHKPGELSVTIKYGRGYDESWAVFRGESSEAIQTQLRSYFGLGPDFSDGLTLHELVLNCTKVAHGGSAASEIARAVPSGSADSVSSTNDDKPDPWKQAETPADPEPELTLTDLVRKCESVKDLQLLWSENKQAFADDPDLMAAYKAHGTDLQTAATVIG